MALKTWWDDTAQKVEIASKIAVFRVRKTVDDVVRDLKAIPDLEQKLLGALEAVAASAAALAGLRRAAQAFAERTTPLSEAERLVLDGLEAKVDLTDDEKELCDSLRKRRDAK